MQFKRSSVSASFSRGSALQSWRSKGLFGSSDFGNNQDDAENVGTLKRGTSYSYSGDVGGRDLDFFKFQNDQKRSPFSLSLRNKSSDEPIAVSILNRRGKVIKQGNQFLFKNIEAGETGTISVNGLRRSSFFIRIQSAEGRNEDYDLEFSLSSTGSVPINDAFNIGSLSPGRRYAYNGRVGSSDVDFYRFQVNETSRISSSLFSDRFNDESIAFSVLDSQRQTVQTGSGRFLFTNVNPGQIGTLFAPTLTPGEYYLRVQSALGRDEQYRLELARSAVTVTPLAA